MDLELTDEQTWLSESLTTLLEREWPRAEVAHEAGRAERDRLWAALVDFGLLAVDPEEGLGGDRALSRRAGASAPTSPPRRSSAAPRCASRPGPPRRSTPSATRAYRSRCSSPAAAGRSASALTSTRPRRRAQGRGRARGRGRSPRRRRDGRRQSGAGARGRRRRRASSIEPQASLDVGVPMHAVTFTGADAEAVLDGDQAAPCSRG